MSKKTKPSLESSGSVLGWSRETAGKPWACGFLGDCLWRKCADCYSRGFAECELLKEYILPSDMMHAIEMRRYAEPPLQILNIEQKNLRFEPPKSKETQSSKRRPNKNTPIHKRSIIGVHLFMPSRSSQQLAEFTGCRPDQKTRS